MPGFQKRVFSLISKITTSDTDFQSLKVLEFPEFLSEVKTELKIIKAVWFNSLQSCLIRIKQIVDSVRNCIVKKAWDSKESF